MHTPVVAGHSFPYSSQRQAEFALFLSVHIYYVCFFIQPKSGRDIWYIHMYIYISLKLL